MLCNCAASLLEAVADWEGHAVGRPAARSVALRTLIVSVLKAAEDPLPTPEIIVRVADSGRNCNSPRGPVCPDWSGRAGGVYPHCPAWCWETPGPKGPQLRPQLLALERLGIVERVHYPNRASIAKAVAAGNVYDHVMSARTGCVYWQCVDNASDAYFNAVVDAIAEE